MLIRNRHEAALQSFGIAEAIERTFIPAVKHEVLSDRDVKSIVERGYRVALLLFSGKDVEEIDADIFAAFMDAFNAYGVKIDYGRLVDEMNAKGLYTDEELSVRELEAVILDIKFMIIQYDKLITQLERKGESLVALHDRHLRALKGLGEDIESILWKHPDAVNIDRFLIGVELLKYLEGAVKIFYLRIQDEEAPYNVLYDTRKKLAKVVKPLREIVCKLLADMSAEDFGECYDIVYDELKPYFRGYIRLSTAKNLVDKALKRYYKFGIVNYHLTVAEASEMADKFERAVEDYEKLLDWLDESGEKYDAVDWERDETLKDLKELAFQLRDAVQAKTDGLPF